MDDARHLRRRIVQVTDENGLRRTDDDTRRLEAGVDAVRAEVALLRGMIVRVDEDGVVRTRRDARLAADADALVEVDDAVGPAVHRGRRTRGDARCVLALVAARDLEGAACARERTDVDVLDVGAGDAERHLVLRLAGRATGVTADALAVIDQEAVVGHPVVVEHARQVAAPGVGDVHHHHRVGRQPVIHGIDRFAQQPSSIRVCLVLCDMAHQ